MVNRNFRLKAGFAAGLCILLLSSFANAETTVGRWCDRTVSSMPQFNRVMTIVLTQDAHVELSSEFNDGSSSVLELQELPGNMYALANSQSGERYRIISADGSLQLLDADGLVRTATRLENSPQTGECGS
ncbi:hypothetical protein [Kineobactrum salinum]|uniref:Lysozyme inhibitor n=1 Tax=Kineobactrum salinum TaxID=2708301 RepID=A0A6C0U4L9_9GAMM|nr:hypothetical protein [Kineobactrum salinum]QIB65345.1 hypothetical protein G3T16_07970 [Kineobactrum salinum]